MEAQCRLDIFAEIYGKEDPTGNVLGKRPCFGFAEGNGFSGGQHLAQLNKEAKIPET